MGEISIQRLEDLIVEAFKKYEQGLWPVSMRHTARAIIEESKVNVLTTDGESLGG
jgi:hypothetical protein